ncbi:serpin A12-like [Hyperolius riggenbachi]|uniref:serpin A12-like n=1 Tax=Hyperolius riggenbachi TaxID=752182 RepID=UPI0035A2B9E4
MRALLIFCVSAALLHAAISKNGYLKLRLPHRNSPPGSSNIVIVIVAFSLRSLDAVYQDLSNPDGVEVTTEGVTILVNETWSPPNPKISVINQDFSSPDVTKNIINSFASSMTSGQIDTLVDKVGQNTVAIIMSLVDAWKVLPEVSKGWTAQLSGDYNVVEDKGLGGTLIEVPNNEFMSAIFAKPDPGREKEFYENLVPETIDTLRESMTRRSVTEEFPKVTLYAGSYELVETFSVGNHIYTSTKYGYKMAASF